MYQVRMEPYEDAKVQYQQLNFTWFFANKPTIQDLINRLQIEREDADGREFEIEHLIEILTETDMYEFAGYSKVYCVFGEIYISQVKVTEN